MRKISLGFAAVIMAASAWLLTATQVQAAACPAPATDLGSATMTVSVPASGSYRVWSRIMAPDTTNNSYSLDIDGANCYTVGDSQIPANAWTWVDYQTGSSSSKIDVTLSAGTHNLKLVGREAGVAVDRVIMVADTTCVPTDTGNNCLVDVDQTPPTVSLTAPAAGATVSGKVSVTASATDTNGIGKVEFYVDNILKGTVASAPYTYSWDTTTVTNSTHSLTVKAYDKSGNVSAASANVTVQNGDTQAPTAPGNLTATASSPTTVDLKWNASTDNVGVAKYNVYRGTTKIATVTTTSYGDTGLKAGTKYSYYVTAEDAAGNVSAKSATATATTNRATKRGHIKGQVTLTSSDTVSAASGDTASYASVTIWVNGNKRLEYTNRKGNYDIGRLPAGTYTVKYASRGRVSQTVQVTVGEGQTVIKNVSLKRK